MTLKKLVKAIEHNPIANMLVVSAIVQHMEEIQTADLPKNGLISPDAAKAEAKAILAMLTS